MEIPWAVLISLPLPIIALLVKSTMWDGFEEDSTTKLVAGLLLLGVAATATGIYFLNPELGPGEVKLSTITNALSFYESEELP